MGVIKQFRADEQRLKAPRRRAQVAQGKSSAQMTRDQIFTLNIGQLS
jgi:hypothetical protein